LNRIGQKKSTAVVGFVQEQLSLFARRIISRKTNKFARRFVIGGNVIIRMTHRYLMNKAPDSEMPFLARNQAPEQGDLRCERQS
jgi:hypothetical protein